jgi:hypothetical protein
MPARIIATGLRDAPAYCRTAKPSRCFIVNACLTLHRELNVATEVLHSAVTRASSLEFAGFGLLAGIAAHHLSQLTLYACSEYC